MTSKQLPDTQKSKSSIKQQREIISYDAPPLDFANLNIKSLNDLKLLVPRQGKRKPFNQDQEEQKDGQNKGEQNEEAAQLNQPQTQINQEEENNADEEEKEKEKERKEKERVKEQRGVPSIIRTLQPSVNTYQVTSANVNSNVNVRTAKKQIMDESQKQEQNQLRIKLIQSSLVLSYNKIGSIQNFFNIIDLVMQDCKNLQWIDLSHNCLTNIDYNFQDFPNLKSLNLHGNYLSDLNELQHLQHLKELRTLTIHGNPLDTIPSFRLYVLGILPQLKKLDSVLVSKKELDNVLVWKFNFKMINPPQPKVMMKPKGSFDEQ